MGKMHGDLELDQDIPMEKLMLTLQKVGWALVLLGLGLALAGIFGSGPFSRVVKASDNRQLLLTYERFERRLKDTTFRVEAASAESIGLDRRYLEHAEIKHINPPPADVKFSESEIEYSFDHGPGRLLVDFSFQLKNKPGLARGAVRAGDTTVGFQQIIYP
jgi:hypothetical protein